MTANVILILALAALAVAAVLLGPAVAAWRRRRLAQRPFPAHWQRVLGRRVPAYRRLPQSLRPRLHHQIQVFMAEKAFYGCAGFQITEAVRLTIAAQACLLVLNREDCFPLLRAVLVYPAEFVVSLEDVDEAGVHAREEQIRSGESWETGRVILSWDDVRRGALAGGDGYNVVLHEFAHQLDLESGGMEGAPVLGSDARYRSWAEIFAREFERLGEAAARGAPSVIDPYGAESPSEFFAVATEAFFESAPELARAHPDLYAELAAFYGVDPAVWH